MNTFRTLAFATVACAIASTGAFAQTATTGAMKKDDHMTSGAMTSGAMTAKKDDHMSSGAMKKDDKMMAKKDDKMMAKKKDGAMTSGAMTTPKQ